jgi:hypothetical protein
LAILNVNFVIGIITFYFLEVMWQVRGILDKIARQLCAGSLAHFFNNCAGEIFYSAIRRPERIAYTSVVGVFHGALVCN